MEKFRLTFSCIMRVFHFILRVVHGIMRGLVLRENSSPGASLRPHFLASSLDFNTLQQCMIWFVSTAQTLIMITIQPLFKRFLTLLPAPPSIRLIFYGPSDVNSDHVFFLRYCTCTWNEITSIGVDGVVSTWLIHSKLQAVIQKNQKWIKDFEGNGERGGCKKNLSREWL